MSNVNMLETRVVKVMKKEERCLTVEELVIGSGKGCLAGAVGTAAGSAVSATGIYAACPVTIVVLVLVVVVMVPLTHLPFERMNPS